MNELSNGTIEVPWRLIVMMSVLAVAGLTFVLSWLLDQAKPAPMSRRERLDASLDGVWDREATEGISPDTVELFRASARVARLERIGAPASVLLAELGWVELHAGRVHQRVGGVPGVQAVSVEREAVAS